MTEEPAELVTFEQAQAMLADGPVVEVLAGRAGDELKAGKLHRDCALALLRAAPQIDVAGPTSRARGFGLCVVSPDRTEALFIKTREAMTND